MNHTLPTGKCPVEWCDQGTRPHTRHEATLGTWRGQSLTPPLRPIDAQIVVHGHSTEEAAPMLVLVDRLTQTDVVLTWDQLIEFTAQAVGAIGRFRMVGR